MTNDFELRCQRKEQDIKDLSILVGKLETTVTNLNHDISKLVTEQNKLIAWKNKAIGYLTVLAFVANYITEHL